MDLPTQIGIIYNIKPRDAVPLKLGDKFLTYLTKLLLKVKAGICSTIK